MEVSGQLHDPATLLQGKSPGTHLTEDWVGPKVDLDKVVKRKIA
jgi:hypothetical protein